MLVKIDRERIKHRGEGKRGGSKNNNNNNNKSTQIARSKMKCAV